MAEEKKASGLDRLPVEASVFSALEWLGIALRLPRGYRVALVIRHGIGSDDPMTVLIDGHGDDQPSFTVRFEKQSQALRGSSLRAVIASSTRGRIRIPYYGERDATEIYVALCLAADGSLTSTRPTRRAGGSTS